MPNLQSLVLTDRQATAVNHTLNPVKETDGVGTVAATDATGALITEKRFSIGTRRTNGRTRSTMKLRVPVVVTEVINGANYPKVVREAFVDCTFTFSDDSTEAERNDVVGMFASALMTTKPLVHDVLVKGQSIW